MIEPGGRALDLDDIKIMTDDHVFGPLPVISQKGRAGDPRLPVLPHLPHPP